MNYLYGEHLTVSFGEKVLFEDLSISINQGQKVALVGRNGIGKSTLLNMLATGEAPEGSKVITRKGLNVGFLNQDDELDDNKTVLENIFDSNKPAVLAVKHYEHCLAHNVEGDELYRAMGKMDELNAWNLEAKASEILSRLSITDQDALVKNLSGGQRKRIALARVLLHEPAFLILDEPTNHLDLEMINWLEAYLKKNVDTLLLITHDRDFMDNVCNEIFEMDNGQLYYYEGNYQYYVEKKAERQEIETQTAEKARSLLRKELEWMRRQPKARTVKAKSRIDAFYELKQRATLRKQQEEMQAEIKIQRLGGKILEFHHVHKAYGDKVILKDFNYKFKTGERVGIAGRNGIGKSTLLNMMVGTEQPDTGKVVKGDTVIFGYYTQGGLKDMDDKRIIEVVREIADYIELTKGKTITAAQLLERFLFTRDQHYTYVGSISGGEKRRLYLLTILMKNPNFLILDEPTNDLDIMTQNVLEEFLEEYPGCLVVVSHDRHFMRKITDHLLVFEGDGDVIDFPGNYTEYLEWKSMQTDEDDASVKQKITASEASTTVIAAPAKPKAKISFKQKHELETVEKEIATLEARKKEVTELLQTELNYNDVQRYGIELNKLVEDIDAKTLRWVELSELAAG